MQDTHIPAIVMKCLIMMIRTSASDMTFKASIWRFVNANSRSINCVKASLLNDIPADVIAYVTLGQFGTARLIIRTRGFESGQKTTQVLDDQVRIVVASNEEFEIGQVMFVNVSAFRYTWFVIFLYSLFKFNSTYNWHTWEQPLIFPTNSSDYR